VVGNWRRWNLTLAQHTSPTITDIAPTFEDLDPTSPDLQRPEIAYRQLLQRLHFFQLYTGLIDKNLKITFGIRNVLDKKTALHERGGQNYFQGGYDPGYVGPARQDVLLSAPTSSCRRSYRGPWAVLTDAFIRTHEIDSPRGM